MWLPEIPTLGLGSSASSPEAVYHGRDLGLWSPSLCLLLLKGSHPFFRDVAVFHTAAQSITRHAGVLP